MNLVLYRTAIVKTNLIAPPLSHIAKSANPKKKIGKYAKINFRFMYASVSFGNQDNLLLDRDIDTSGCVPSSRKAFQLCRFLSRFVACERL